ncbi:transcriptional regulator, AlpA family [Nitrosospira sp. Nl5]|nr:transcriptional regulator, AlpA family [Nitrosospira sp. Nl5]
MTRRIIPRSLPDALKNFDLLPDSAYVQQAIVEGLFDCSASTVWRMVRRGELPVPHKITERSVRWQVGELRRARKG